MNHFLRYLKIAFSCGYIPTINDEREFARLKAQRDQAIVDMVGAQTQFFKELAKH